MKFYLNREKTGIKAVMEYNPDDGAFIVESGSNVSEAINHNSSFRGAKAIEKARGNGVVVGRVVTRDIAFKSASTAANFVTGNSTNGLVCWKNAKGVCIKRLMDEGELK